MAAFLDTAAGGCRAGASRRGRVFPPLLPSRRRRSARHADGCAAAARGCRALYRRLELLLRDLGFSAPEIFAEDRCARVSADRGFRRRHLHPPSRPGRRRAGPLHAGGGYADRAAARRRARAARPACPLTTRRGCSPRPRCWSIGICRRSRKAARPMACARSISTCGERSCRKPRFPKTLWCCATTTSTI